MRDFGTGTQVVIGVLGGVVVDLELVVVEVCVRHIAIGIARPAYYLTSSVSPTIFKQNYLRSLRVAEKFSESEFVKIR